MGAKDSNREGILEAAASLFLRNGLGSVSMNEIATEASCTRRTLYRHFATREDLIFCVVTDLLEGWNTEQTQEFAGLEGTGHHRLGAFLHCLADRLQHQRPFLRLMGEFDFLFQDSFPFQPDHRAALRFHEAARFTETLLEALIDQGRADGSIQADLNPRLLVSTMSTVLWGTAQRIAIRDHLIHEEFGIDGSELIRTQIDLYLQALAMPS